MIKKILSGFLGVVCVIGLQAQAANPTVVMETNKGAVVIELYPDKAPITVENFLGYVKDGFYDGTIFHRVIGNFMIQGGGHTEEFYQDTNKEKTTRAAIKNESDNGLSNLPGTIAMARTSDPHSATSQFFISVKDNSYLDGQPGVEGRPGRPGYTVFGKVIEGMDVVMSISKIETRKLGLVADVPIEPIVIKKVTVK